MQILSVTNDSEQSGDNQKVAGGGENGNDELIPEELKEKIKIGQEINNNRPKESKGHRSSEKRKINNQSLGITTSGAKSIQVHTT